MSFVVNLHFLLHVDFCFHFQIQAQLPSAYSRALLQRKSSEVKLAH